MLFVAILISLIAVYLIQMNIFSKHSYDNLEYKATLSAEEVFEDEDIFMYEELQNNKNLPIPNAKIDTELPVGLMFRLIDRENSSKDKYQSYIQSFFVIGSRSHIRRRWRITCKKRGIYTVGSAMMVTNDLLGFNASSKRFENAPNKFNRVTVLPKPLNLNEHFTSSRYHSGDITVPRSMLTDPLRIVGTREYTSYDPMNRINWKSTAVHGKLMVNTEEYTQRNLFNIVMNMQSYDIEKGDIPTSADYVESCITVCASLLDRISGDNIPVRLIINTPPQTICTEYVLGDEIGKQIAVTKAYQGKRDIIEALRLLASLELKISCPIEKMLDNIMLHPELYSGGGNIIFVSAYISERMINCAEILCKKGVRVIFYVTTTHQNAMIIPREIEVYFRTNSGGEWAGYESAE